MANPNRSPRYLDDQIILSNDASWELGVEQSPYDKLNSDTYSNKLDLRSTAKQCQDVAYRLVVYVKDAPEVRSCIQYLAHGVRKEDQQFFGRPLDREKVDTYLLKKWLRLCEDWHGDICEQDGVSGQNLPTKLRLIDVEERTIVKVSTARVQYLTLSYVWGTDDMLRETGMTPVVTNRADIRFSSTGEELTPLPDHLPQTIEDAISLTLTLGFRYLLVDAFCIIQDDPTKAKNLHLERMDAVYNCSTLTIAAASGLHADSGIPGISVPRKNSPWPEKIQGMHLAAMSPSFTELENSQSLIWNTRGWTFQEKILAKRILLFTDYQVYYRCSESVWTEEIVNETKRLSNSIESRPGKYRWAADRPRHNVSGKLLLLKMIVPQLHVDDQWSYLGRFPDYAAAIREYTQRTLTNPNDILIAISGVLKTLKPDTGQFICGLPKAYFAQSLLWYPEPGKRHIRSDPNLPSWTWAAWHCVNGVGYDVLDVRMIRTIMITIRNLLARLGKAMAKASSGSSDSDSSSSSDYSGDSGSSSSSTSSSTSSSSPSTYYPYEPPKKKRDWSTRKIVGKASGNIVACFGWPLAVRDHTVKHMFYCAEKKVTPLNCQETLSLHTFMADGTMFKENENNSSKSSRSRQDLQDIARKYRFLLLSMETIIVKLNIGRCLHHILPTHDDDASVFELVDHNGSCVGEVWTTLGLAKEGREEPLEFLTINWGLSLSVAEIDEAFIPRWTFDSAKLPESQIFMNCRSFFEEALRPAPSKGLMGRYGVNSAQAEQPSVMKFLDALFTAKKGQPRPNFLWSTVNLILVEWDGPIARRVGVGKVIFNAWLLARELFGTPEEVILA
jgi:hypothetical protein